MIHDLLTEEELAIAKLIAEEVKAEDICECLNIHIHNLNKKLVMMRTLLNVKTKVGIAVWYARNISEVPTQTILDDFEVVIAKYISEGKTNKELCRLCDLTLPQVAFKVRTLLRKLNLKCRGGVGVWIAEHKL